MTHEQHPIQTTRSTLNPTPAPTRDPMAAIRRACANSLPFSDAAIARVAWSVIVEPGDLDTGALIRQHGPVAALDLVVNSPTPGIPERLIHLAGAQYNPSRVARRLDLTHEDGFAILIPEDASWPARLGVLGDTAPLVLWCHGSTEALQTDRTTAIAGSRAATSYGERVTMNFAAELVAAGHGVVTGAAYGIDGMATRAALAGQGTAVVVLAGGVDRLYPSGHRELIARVATSGGVVISELPPSTGVTKWRFLQRNGIIAALGQQLVIVEAGDRSGSLNTAGHANAIGTPVYAVPGPVTSPTSVGCHRLIREGRARLITSASEIAM